MERAKRLYADNLGLSPFAESQVRSTMTRGHKLARWAVEPDAMGRYKFTVLTLSRLTFVENDSHQLFERCARGGALSRACVHEHE